MMINTLRWVMIDLAVKVCGITGLIELIQVGSRIFLADPTCYDVILRPLDPERHEF